MAKAKSTKPIMTPDEERYMAFEGLIQWTHAVAIQSGRVSTAMQTHLSILTPSSSVSDRRQAIAFFHSECHFFAVSANKFLEFLDWVRQFGLCAGIDFSEVDEFSRDDIRDLRNMREHVVDYFVGRGNAPDRWIVKTTEYSADASSVIGTMIGGRLDWVAFGEAARRLLPRLLREPIPYPSLSL